MLLSRRQVSLGLGAMGSLGGLGVAALAAASAERLIFRRPRAQFTVRSGQRPNILLILTDQERHPSLLPPDLPLPHRSDLMERATRFANLQNVTALCSMARGAIYSGQHYQHTGVSENVPIPMSHDLNRAVPTLGTLLQDAGYETAYFGKWHLSKEPWLNTHNPDHMRKLFADYGFEYSDQPSEVEGVQGGYKHDGATAAAAARFVHARKSRERPWFAAVNFVNPHDIMFTQTTARQDETYRFNPILGERITPVPNDPLYHQDLGYGLPSAFGTAGDRDKPGAHDMFRRVIDTMLGGIPISDQEAWRRHQNTYFNCLRDVDRRIGTVMEALRATGAASNTVIIFTSDHGDLGGAHGLREKGNNIYRQTASVPLAIVHPDIKDGSDSAALASQIDLLPTLLSFAGVTDAERMTQVPMLRGHDLSRAMGQDRGLGAAGRTAAYYQWDSRMYATDQGPILAADAVSQTGLNRLKGLIQLRQAVHEAPTRDGLRGAFDGRFKFARYFRPQDRSQPNSHEALSKDFDLELYDTAADPDERINLARDPKWRPDLMRMNALTNVLIAKEVGKDDAPPMSVMA